MHEKSAILRSQYLYILKPGIGKNMTSVYLKRVGMSIKLVYLV